MTPTNFVLGFVKVDGLKPSRSGDELRVAPVYGSVMGAVISAAYRRALPTQVVTQAGSRPAARRC